MKKAKKDNDIAICWLENHNPFFLICPWQRVHFTATVKRLLSMGLSVEDIAKATSLSVEQVEKIKAEQI